MHVSSLPYSCIGGGDLLQFPRLKHLTRFAYVADDGQSPPPDSFLTQNRDTVRSVSLSGEAWLFSLRAVPIRHLAHLSFDGTFEHAHVLAELLRAGHQLESLRLTVTLRTPLASAFRAAAADGSELLPLLRYFAFGVRAGSATDAALFPAVADFLRGRARLRTLHLAPPAGADTAQRALGYDAAVWGVLPSLSGLRGLQIVLPADVAPSLASWLLPRGLLALSMSGSICPYQRAGFVPVRTRLCTSP